MPPNWPAPAARRLCRSVSDGQPGGQRAPGSDHRDHRLARCRSPSRDTSIGLAGSSLSSRGGGQVPRFNRPVGRLASDAGATPGPRGPGPASRPARVLELRPGTTHACSGRRPLRRSARPAAPRWPSVPQMWCNHRPGIVRAIGAGERRERGAGGTSFSCIVAVVPVGSPPCPAPGDDPVGAQAGQRVGQPSRRPNRH